MAIPDLDLQIRRVSSGHLAIKMFDKNNFDGRNFIDNGDIGDDNGKILRRLKNLFLIGVCFLSTRLPKSKMI